MRRLTAASTGSFRTETLSKIRSPREPVRPRVF
jgi:hypothetical protein